MPRRLWLALVLLLPIVVLTIVLASTVRFRGALSVDNRQYVEMATGTRAHGLPYTLNKYSEDFPEARPAFNVPRDGKLWGTYPPLYSYAGALALRMGGLAALARESVVFIGILAIAVFLLGWQFTRDPLRGVAASYFTVFATPVWATSFQTLALPLLYLWLTLAALAALMAIDARGRRQFALSFLAGGLAGLAVATHLLAFLMAVMLVAALGLAIREDERDRGWRGWLPTRAALLRSVCATVGLVLPMIPMALLNELRFGSYNPLSYGPCIWAQCNYNGAGALNARGLLAFALPAVPYFVAVAVALYFARKRWWAVLLVLGASALALGPSTPVGDPAWIMLRTAYGYAFDTTWIDFGEPVSDLGHLKGGQAVKSLLQSCPALLLSLIVPIGRRGPAARTLIILLPIVGLFANLALFGRFPGANAFGWPYVLLRYTIPAAPLLSVLVIDVVASVRWRAVHVAIGLGVALGGIFFFLTAMDDASLLRRVLELRVTLVIGLAALVLVALARRIERRALAEAAVVCAAMALGASSAVSMGVDTRVLTGVALLLDARVEKLAKITPERFALVGYGPVADPVLTLRAERDINYIDLLEAKNGSWENFRILIDLWAADERPIFGVFPNDIMPPFKWPYASWDVPAERVDASYELWKIGPPAVPLTDEQLEARRRFMREDWERRAAAGSIVP